MPEPARGFSLRTATFVVVSSTVGGGILSTSGYVALDVGSNGLMLGLWIVGGLIAACGALAMAEVSAALPRSGGEFVILSEAYGPLAGFVGGWVSLLFGFVAPIAASGSSAAAYLLAPSGSTSLSATRTLATVLILGFGLAHTAGRSRTERVQGIVTAATLALLGAFVVVGVPAGWPNRASLLDIPPIRGLTGSPLFVGLIVVSYAYTGWNGASYVAGEIEDPARCLPRAILLGTGLVILLYCGLNLVFALALPIGDLRALTASGDRDAVQRIAELSARRLFGDRIAVAVSLASGVVLLASLSAMILTGPRVAFAMARERRLPALFGRLSARGQTPVSATALVVAGAIALLWSGSFEQIITAAGVGLALNSMLTVAAVYVLRWTQPDLPRPFRVPGYPVVPAAFLLLTAGSLAFAFADRANRYATLAGVGGVVLAIPLYWLTRDEAGESA